jgi:bleomycin hydrolase
MIRYGDIMRNFYFISMALIIFLLLSGMAMAGENSKPVYQFKTELEVPHTPVKSQDSTGTCWCFATLSFLESELLRQGKGTFDLSEMYVVRNVYPLKADNYIRLQGAGRFSEGGLSHDVLNAILLFGIVPEETYNGKNIGEKYHNHREMFAVLHAMLDAVLEKKGEKITPRWKDAFRSTLDAYLGVPPETFTYKGKSYTPQEFSRQLELDLDDYIELTSYSHHPFYRKIRLEIPDNWTSYDGYYNLPLDELEAVVDQSLREGYSVVWDGDVSEDSYADEETNYAIIPQDMSNDKQSENEEIHKTGPVAEKEITQEYRQQTFDNQTTSDDHLMHMVGIAHDQHDHKFYIMKDSWYANTPYHGIIYLSRPYLRLKTTGVMVNRRALTQEMRKKMGVE